MFVMLFTNVPYRRAVSINPYVALGGMKALAGFLYYRY